MNALILKTMQGFIARRSSHQELSRGDVVGFKDSSGREDVGVVCSCDISTTPYPEITGVLRRAKPTPIADYGGFICEFDDYMFTYWLQGGRIGFADNRDEAIEALRILWTATFFNTVDR